MIVKSLVIFAALSAVGVTHAATVVPTAYEAGHFFATPTTTDGKVMRLLVDTGGGGASYWLFRDVADRLKLPAVACGEGDFVAAPSYATGKGLPKPLKTCGAIGVIGTKDAGELRKYQDGLVGAWYLAQRVWTFDYPRHTLAFEEATWKPDATAHVVSPGFPHRPDGQLGSAFPRVGIVVEGENIDVLLDTGATAHPSPAGLAAMKTPVVDGISAGSYITTGIMDRWHRDHPDWPLVDKADDLFGPGKEMRAIQVPHVTIAGWTVGPIWFTERHDKNFEQVMSSYMDQTVHGAIGGNVLQAFRMTIDYAKGKAWFACVEHCTAAK